MGYHIASKCRRNGKSRRANFLTKEKEQRQQHANPPSRLHLREVLFASLEKWKNVFSDLVENSNAMVAEIRQNFAECLHLHGWFDAQSTLSTVEFAFRAIYFCLRRTTQQLNSNAIHSREAIMMFYCWVGLRHNHATISF